MPLLQKQDAVFNDQRTDAGQFVASETFRHRKIDGIKPVFRNLVSVFNMNVRRF